MAGKKEKEEDLIDVGEENEKEVDVVVEDEDENPNVVDQLEEAAEGDDEETPDEEVKDERTPEQKIHDYLESDPELKDHYSKSVQKRIDKLTYDWREAERREKAATEFAQNVQKENAELKAKQQQQDGVFINEHKNRLEAQLEGAKASYKEAVANGDPELIAEANALMSTTAAELAQAKQTETRYERFVKTTPSPEEEITPYQPEGAQPAQPQPDEKAEAWAQKNTWFGEDQEMTQAALNIHQRLVTEDGYLPTSNAYYSELDNRLRKNYPDYFKVETPTEDPPHLQGEQVVTPPSTPTKRPGAKGKKNIRLTRSEVAIAKKLGVPLEEYAKYVVR